MSTDTSDWDSTLRGEPADAVARDVEPLAARHREDGARRRLVVAASAGLGAGVVAVLNSFFVHPWLAMRMAAGRIPHFGRAEALAHLGLHVLALTAAVLGGAALLRQRQVGRRIMPAWFTGGLFWGAGLFVMLDGVLDRALLRILHLQTYLAWEIAALALMMLGRLALRHPRGYRR